MNIYKYKFPLVCPVNKLKINYKLKIISKETIMVELIASQINSISEYLHEDLADAFFAKFGGVQVLTAHHHGIDIKTIRGEE